MIQIVDLFDVTSRPGGDQAWKVIERLKWYPPGDRADWIKTVEQMQEAQNALNAAIVERLEEAPTGGEGSSFDPHAKTLQQIVWEATIPTLPFIGNRAPKSDERPIGLLSNRTRSELESMTKLRTALSLLQLIVEAQNELS